MRKLIILILVLFVSTSMYAETVTVDGTTHSTLSAAIAALNRNDGAADTIDITVDTFTETATVAIDFTGNTDALTINGDADSNGNCVIVFTSGIGDYGIEVTQVPGVSFTMQDLTLVPEYSGAGVNDFGKTALLINDDGTNPLNGNVVFLDNIIVTASVSGNAAVDPDVDSPADFTRWAGNATTYCSGIRVDDTLDGPATTDYYDVTLQSCKVAHTNYRGYYIRHDTGVVEQIGCTAKFNESVGFRTYDMNAEWILEGCLSEYNAGHNLEISAGTGTVRIEEGCSFSYGRELAAGGGNAYGISQAASGGDIYFVGSATEPIKIVGNLNRGFRFNAGDATIKQMDYVIISDNGWYGLEFYEIDQARFPAAFNKLLIANNGAANFKNGDTNDTPNSLEFKDCTFHAPGRGGLGDGHLYAGHIRHTYNLSNNLTYTFTDCIFSGIDGATMDLVLNIPTGEASGNTYNFNYCALVTSGRNSLYTPYIFDEDSANTVNELNCIGLNPRFMRTSTSPVTDLSFAVTNAAFGNLSSTGGALTGWGDFAPYSVTSVKTWGIYK